MKTTFFAFMASTTPRPGDIECPRLAGLWLLPDAPPCQRVHPGARSCGECVKALTPQTEYPEIGDDAADTPGE